MLARADLAKAQKLFADRDLARRMRERLRTESVALMIGDGKEASVIHLSADFLGQIVFDVKAAFDDKIKACNKTLTEMGVEP